MPAKKTSQKTKKNSAKTTKTSAKSAVNSSVTASPVISSKSIIKTSKLFNWVTIGLLIVLIALSALRFGYFIVPASVNGKPIFSWQYVKSLHAMAGAGVINQLVTEELINQEAKAKNIEVTKEDIDKEINRLEAQFESSGGLDMFLSSQGLTREQIEDQIKVNIKVEKMVSGAVEVTDEEVDQYYTDNQADFEGMTEEEAKTEIKDMLHSQELQQQISLWLQALKTKSKTKINLPGIDVL